MGVTHIDCIFLTINYLGEKLLFAENHIPLSVRIPILPFETKKLCSNLTGLQLPLLTRELGAQET